MDKNYTSYNINGSAYEDRSNNEEDGKTYEDGSGANTTHEDGIIYPPTPVTNNPP